MPDATNTDDYMGTEGAKSAVKVVQEKIEAMMEKPEEELTEEGGESGEPEDMKGLTILAIRSALKQDSEKKEAKKKETEQEALNV